MIMQQLIFGTLSNLIIPLIKFVFYKLLLNYIITSNSLIRIKVHINLSSSPSSSLSIRSKDSNLHWTSSKKLLLHANIQHVSELTYYRSRINPTRASSWKYSHTHSIFFFNNLTTRLDKLLSVVTDVAFNMFWLVTCNTCYLSFK